MGRLPSYKTGEMPLFYSGADTRMQRINRQRPDRGFLPKRQRRPNRYSVRA